MTNTFKGKNKFPNMFENMYMFVYIQIFQKDTYATVTSIYTFTFHFMSFYLVQKYIFFYFIKARKEGSKRMSKEGAG